jgi:hypothetical protein
MDRVTWSRIRSWTLGIGVSFWRRSRPMLLHVEYAGVFDVGANPFIPSQAATYRLSRSRFSRI